MRSFSALFLSVLVVGVADVRATTYHVAQSSKAADSNPGTEAAPWKTISRAAAAKELQPGDTVAIHAGVYREQIDVKVSGEPGRPITFSAESGSRVVVKGSEVVHGLFRQTGTGFALPTWDGLPKAEPLPNDLRQQGPTSAARWLSSGRMASPSLIPVGSSKMETYL